MRNKRNTYWDNKEIGKFCTEVDGNQITYYIDDSTDTCYLEITGNTKYKSEVSGITEVEEILTNKGLF